MLNFISENTKKNVRGKAVRLRFSHSTNTPVINKPLNKVFSAQSSTEYTESIAAIQNGVNKAVS